jgi:hypothetical protein
VHHTWVGRVNFYFKKNSKRRRFSYKKKKNKSQRVATGFLNESPGQPAGSHRVVAYAIFSSTRPGSIPGSTRRAGPGFKTLMQSLLKNHL